MRLSSVLRVLAVFVLLPLPTLADSLQKKYEARGSAADAVKEGLVLASGQDLASYLTAFREAYDRVPIAWANYEQALKAGADAGKARARFLEEIKLPISAAHLLLARHYLQSKRTYLGYGLDIAEVFHQDLDRAIVLKNASTLHSFFFRYLAKADLKADANNPSIRRTLLAALVRENDGYSIDDFKDIFYYQAPEATADYIDEEIFSLYRTRKEQTAAAALVLRLISEVGDAHERLQRVLGALAFGKEVEPPTPPSFKVVQEAVSGWALKQGLMRTALFGEELVYQYSLCLKKPDCLDRLRALGRR